MTPYFLKFTDETAAIAALAQYRSEEGEWLTASHIHALDVVGVIHKPTGEMIDDMPVMAPLGGYHINLMIDSLPAELEPYVVSPTNPVRIWA